MLSFTMPEDRLRSLHLGNNVSLSSSSLFFIHGHNVRAGGENNREGGYVKILFCVKDAVNL